jgi:hypothetical protein
MGISANSLEQLPLTNYRYGAEISASRDTVREGKAGDIVT